MPDKIVNHFVLADGSTAKYDAGSLINLDDTVSLAGYAPDAKAVGDRVYDLQSNLFDGYVINPANIFEDYKLDTATALDDNTEILDATDTPSKIIHITNTDNTLKGARVYLGDIFKPFQTGVYYIHFRARTIRNSAYAYQNPNVLFYMYNGTSLKGSKNVPLTVPSATAEDNDFLDYTLVLDGTQVTFSDFDYFNIYTNTKFDYWIKDLYICKNTDNTDGYCIDFEKIAKDANKTSLKLGVIGDSLSATTNSFAKKWHYYLGEKQGYTIDNVSVSGSGYWNGSLQGGTSDHQFYNQALNIDNDCDIVCIFGGFNDVSHVVAGEVELGTKTDNTTTTIGGCINQTLDNILTVNPLVRIAVVSPTPWQGYNPMISETSTYYTAVLGVYNLIKEICEYRSIPFLDLFKASGLRPWVETFRAEYYISSNDGTHPNAKGHLKFLYPKFRDFLHALNWEY